MDYHATVTPEETGFEIRHKEEVRKLAGECVVVLENDGVLPLEEPCKVALFGHGVRHTVKGGTGSGDVYSRSVTNIEQGLKNAGFTVCTDAWLDKYDKVLEQHRAEYRQRCVKKAEELGIATSMVMISNPIGNPALPVPTEAETDIEDCDTCIFVISRDSGEFSDRKYVRGDYLLSEQEAETVKILARMFSRTIILLNVGGVIDTEEIVRVEGVNALLNISQLGNIGGDVVADVLLGKTDPSGRLADTWARSYEQYPCWQDFSHNNGNTDDEYYAEGIYIGYRYFDTFGITPRFHFGYGLGYTDFEIEPVDAELKGSEVTVKCSVRNIGKRSGKETVQVYLSSPSGRIDKPFKELAAYKKSALLAPGQTEVLSITFDLVNFASYCPDDAAMLLEKGIYVVRVGHNAGDTEPFCSVEIKDDIKTVQMRNLFAPDSEFEELKNPGLRENSEGSDLIPKDLRFVLDPSSVSCRNVDYTDERPAVEDSRKDEFLTFDDVLSGKATPAELAAQMSVKELATLCVGAYDSAAELNAVSAVGCASLVVPGAAAESPEIPSRKIPRTILADGPAGLRLQPHFMADKDGKRIAGGEMLGEFVNPFPENIPEGAVDYYQYCTAIPIATALAQTWNPGLIEAFGRIVGEEMKEFGVHFWLAPGMNIHRNPLCGRNFEYYSEDPLISGLCAAADTKGVQSFGGQGTTIKHYACNNQEENRMFSNSHVSEKALRDLYLRGFGICVRESSPYSIMTSYNLLNGIHTANNRDLIQSVLRDEWGFEGVVMTDWFTSQDVSFMGCFSEIYPISSSVGCIKAGNDWQMPGCLENITDIEKAVESGELDLSDLVFCGTNIIRMAVKCYS